MYNKVKLSSQNKSKNGEISVFALLFLRSATVLIRILISVILGALTRYLSLDFTKYKFIVFCLFGISRGRLA